jgi:site-specific DNA recombinase
MRAVIYTRVSTSDQVKTLSLEVQEKQCRKYCEEHDWEAAAVFVDRGESAKTTDRPEFLKMLRYCQQQRGNVQVLVVYALSRFSRNTSDHHTIRAMLAGAGVRLRSVTEQIDETAYGRFVETVLSGVAQLDNDVKAERTLVGMKEAMRRGRYLWRAPLGYINTHDRQGPSLRIDPVSGPLVRTAFELFARQGAGRPEVHSTVTALGLRTATGKPLGMQAFGTLLRNPVYAGRVASPKWNIEEAGDFEGIVSDAVFRQVQLRLANPAATSKPRRKDDDLFPLRRFARCGTCETPLTAVFRAAVGVSDIPTTTAARAAQACEFARLRSRNNFSIFCEHSSLALVTSRCFEKSSSTAGRVKPNRQLTLPAVWKSAHRISDRSFSASKIDTSPMTSIVVATPSYVTACGTT